MTDQPDPPPVSWNPPVPGTSWDPEPGRSATPPPPPEELAPLGSVPPAPRPRRRAIAIVGAGALVAAGVFAVTQIAGGSDGGADSPEAAMENLVDALNQEDVLGALDVLLPGERRTFRQPMTDMVAELRRLEILGKEADLGAVAGADLEITIDDMDVDEVADDIADVTLSGDVSLDVDQEKLPFGDFIVDQLMDGERPDGSMSEEGSFGRGDDVTLATVRKDGRWYVSLFYTVAEAVRGDADLPDASDAIEPDGADSPEGAVDQMMGAVTDFDLEQAIATLDPNEFEALQRYAPIFLDDAQDALDELDGLSISWEDAEYDVEQAGDGRATIGFSAFRLAGSADGQDASVEWDGECMSVEGSDIDSGKGCVDDDVSLDDLDSDHPLDAAMVGFAKAFADTHPITVSQVDGKWYVSIFGSMFDGMLEALRAVEPDDLKNGFDDLGDLIGGALDGDLTADLPGLGGITVGEDTSPFDTVPESTDDTAPDITTPDDPTPDSALDLCYQISDPAEATACFEDGIADGTIDPSDEPPALRFAECGLAEGWWDYHTYEAMSDEEFVSTVTSAHDCFAQHVAAGDLSEVQIPYEAFMPECWNGKNPYLLGADDYSNAIDEYSACSGQ